MTNESNSTRIYSSLFLAIFAYVWWGVLPIYWKALASIPSGEILAHRIFWAGFLMIILIMFQGGIRIFFQIFKEDKKSIYRCICSSLIITANWLLYIWAVNAGHVLESSIGYFIAPLMNVIMGLILLKEGLNKLQALSVFLAFLGVLVLCLKYERFPWIALGLAISFSAYSYFRKTSKLNSVQGITVETVILMPLSFAYIILLSAKEQNYFVFQNWYLALLLIGGGLVTIVPVLSFSKAAQNLKFSSLGFLQYLMPTIQFLLAVFVFKEEVSTPHFIALSFIWPALILYSFSTYRASLVVKMKES